MDLILNFFKRPLYFVLAAVLILIISVVFFILKPLTTKSRLYIFPDNRFSYIDLEQRNIPQNGDKAQKISNYLKELPAGSRNIEMERFINEETKINSVIFSDGILLIDFSKEMNDLDNKIKLSSAEVKDLLEKNIHLNFKGIDKIYITIEGQTPGAPFYSLE